jgi:hypothetical protein
MARLQVLQLIDTSTFSPEGRPGLQYRRIRGVRVVLEWFVRRLLVPRDGLPWALGTCLDIPSYINATPHPADLARWRTAFDAEGARTEYIVSVQSTLVLDASGVLRYTPRVRVAQAGDYPLVVTIDQAGEILAQFPIS